MNQFSPLTVCERIENDAEKRFRGGPGKGEPDCNTDFCLWKRDWYHVAGTLEPGGRASYPPLNQSSGNRIRSSWDRRMFSPGARSAAATWKDDKNAVLYTLFGGYDLPCSVHYFSMIMFC